MWDPYQLFVGSLLLFHISEFSLAAFFNPNLIERASLLISGPYLAAMSIASLEYWLEQTYFPWMKRPWVTSMGIFLVVAGEILRKSGIITAKHNFTHRVQLKHRPEHSLVTTGIYSYMRHPGYAGWVLWAIGTQVMLCNPICAPLFTYVCLRFMKRRIIIEDQLLRTFFGDEWSAWRKKVPSGLPAIP
ncbi:hypothetical protein Ndes2437B_g05521 [Nannochloris sp. 'desiccata']